MTAPTERTPVTVPTPENVAEFLTSGDNDYHDGNEWTPSLRTEGNVLHIEIEPYDEDGEQCEKVRFRAVIERVEDESAGSPVVTASEVAQLRTRLARAEHVMRRALAEVEHDEVVHLLHRYLSDPAVAGSPS